MLSGHIRGADVRYSMAEAVVAAALFADSHADGIRSEKSVGLVVVRGRSSYQ